MKTMTQMKNEHTCILKLHAWLWNPPYILGHQGWVMAMVTRKLRNSCHGTTCLPYISFDPNLVISVQCHDFLSDKHVVFAIVPLLTYVRYPTYEWDGDLNGAHHPWL